MSKLFLHLRAFVSVIQVKLLLTFTNFASASRFAPRVSKKTCLDENSVTQAIRRASKFIPRTTCLIRATAAHHLLARYGYDSVIRIGVDRDQSVLFSAHAWLVVNGRILLGGTRSSLEKFNVLRDIRTVR